MRSIQPSWVRNGGRPFCGRQECLKDSNQEIIGLIRVAAASDLKQLPHLTRVEGGGSGGRAGTALEGQAHD